MEGGVVVADLRGAGGGELAGGQAGQRGELQGHHGCGSDILLHLQHHGGGSEKAERAMAEGIELERTMEHVDMVGFLIHHDLHHADDAQSLRGTGSIGRVIRPGDLHEVLCDLLHAGGLLRGGVLALLHATHHLADEMHHDDGADALGIPSGELDSAAKHAGMIEQGKELHDMPLADFADKGLVAGLRRTFLRGDSGDGGAAQL